jgi:uracil-DNA glycosylase
LCLARQPERRSSPRSGMTVPRHPVRIPEPSHMSSSLNDRVQHPTDPRQQAVELLSAVRACRRCAGLPFEARPILQFDPRARVLIASQAPGRRAHESGIPFDDPSGDRLRNWMGIDRKEFYDASKIAIVPMAFCYPGTGSAGDLPPRLECAPAWRQRLLVLLPAVRLTLLVGKHALDWHLGRGGDSVTNAVSRWRTYWPDRFPMPHPSPRNNRWLKRNVWFEREVIPALRSQVRAVLDC